MVRLQKFLAESGVASRRKCEELIVSGVVKVNGEVVEILGSKVDPEKDKVTVQGKGVMRINKKRIYLFFKPVNVITTVSDPQERPCVGDYLKNIPERVFPVGRLDFDVTGLLILTNDGDFAEK
jgi:23S rRNA pseudouridine2605 synthase